MADSLPSPEWLEAANRLATVAAQLSNVVHEVNNILQIVSGNAELLESAGGSETVLRRARTIASQAQRASVLLGDVLAFSREAGTDGELVELADVAARALALRKYTFTKLRAEVALETDPGASTVVVGNRQQLLQLALNLLANAERAIGTAEGGRVRLHLSRDGERVVLAVQDNGSGFTALPEGLPAIERSAPGARAQPRLGIGLRVSRLLAEHHGGSLDVRRAEPAGTIAVVRLPATPAEAPLG